MHVYIKTSSFKLKQMDTFQTLEYCSSILLPFLILFGFFSIYIRWTELHWQRQGLPVVADSELEDETNLEEIAAIYNVAKKKKYKHVGYYASFWNRPEYIPVDLELIKVIVKDDSEYFSHGFEQLNFHSPPILRKVDKDDLISLKQDLEHILCSELVQILMQNSVDCATQMSIVLHESILLTNRIDIKEILEEFAIKVISNNILGLKDPGTRIKKYVRKYLIQDPSISLKDLILSKISGLLPKWRMISNEENDSEEWLESLIKKNIRYRRDKNIRSSDMLQVLMELKPEQSLSVEQISRYCLILFKLYIPVLSKILMFAILEIASSPHEQEKIRRDMKPTGDTQHSYEGLDGMSYIENVLNETLRLHPPSSCLYKICKKSYDVAETLFAIQPETLIAVPTSAINMDTELYKNPDSFQPERYNVDVDIFHDISPRMLFCKTYIGSEFVIAQAKIALSTILDNYEITIDDKIKEQLHNDYSLSPNFCIKFSKINK